MSSVTAVPADAQQQNNFNPTWMRSAFNGGAGFSSPRTSMTDGDEADYPLSDPVFAQNRYGREDLLALFGKDVRPPDGLGQCPFYEHTYQQPTITTEYNEMEQRLQSNINSSKAMSMLSHAERASIAQGNAYVGQGAGAGAAASAAKAAAQAAGGGWTPVGAGGKTWNRGSAVAQSPTTPGRGLTRPMFGRGGGTVGSPAPTPNGGGATDESGYRYVPPASRNGRGGTSSGRGGSTTGGATFNSRAQGLYDPHNPKDRPRVRGKSTSEDGEPPVSAAGTPTTPAPATNGWGQSAKPAWGRENSSSGQPQQAAWGGRPNGGETKEAMPEWMNDEDDDDSERDAPQQQPPHQQQQHQQMAGSVAPQQQQQPAQSGWAGSSSSGGAASSTSQMDMAAYAAAAMQRIPQQQQQQYAPPPPPPQPRAPSQFYYLDPNGTERGPFDEGHMLKWYQGGYFNMNLKVRRDTDRNFVELVKLVEVMGSSNPFKAREPSPPPPQPQQPMYAPSPLDSMKGGPFGNVLGSIWNDVTGGGAQSDPMAALRGYGGMGYDPIAMERKRMEEEQRRAFEEHQHKLREMQEQIVRDVERQRAEQERILAEKEQLLRMQQEEMMRREREIAESAKEMEQRLERERLQLEERKREMMAEQLVKDESERKEKEKVAEKERAKQEAVRAEQERKEREAREKREREEAEREAERMRQQAIAAAEKIRAQQLEKKKAEEERKAREAAKLQVEEAWEPAQKPKQVKAEESAWGATPAAPARSDSRDEDLAGWQRDYKSADLDKPVVQKKTSAPVAAPWASASAAAKPREKTMAEILEEEERQARAEKERLAQIRKADQANLASAGTWSNAAQKLSWAGGATHAAPVKSSGSAWGDSRPSAGSSPFWDGPSLAAANRKPAAAAPAPVKKPVAKAPEPKKAAAPVTVSKKTASPAAAFNAWCVEKVKKLSSTVDAEVLCGFIQDVQSPDEVEDFVVGYCGESRAVKDFVKEFLAKRRDLKAGKITADDLSRAAGNSGSSSGGGSAGGFQTQKNKKKGKGGRVVIDGACLGFTASGDPNRVNQGEIDSAYENGVSRR